MERIVCFFLAFLMVIVNGLKVEGKDTNLPKIAAAVYCTFHDKTGTIKKTAQTKLLTILSNNDTYRLIERNLEFQKAVDYLIEEVENVEDRYFVELSKRFGDTEFIYLSQLSITNGVPYISTRLIDATKKTLIAATQERIDIDSDFKLAIEKNTNRLLGQPIIITHSDGNI